MTLQLSHLYAVPIVVLTILMAGPSSAQTTGGDDFDDNSKNMAKWGVDFGYDPTSNLAETNGVIVSTGILTGRPWIENEFPSDSDWEILLDVSLPSSVGVNDCYSIGLMITESEDDASHAIEGLVPSIGYNFNFGGFNCIGLPDVDGPWLSSFGDGGFGAEFFNPFGTPTSSATIRIRYSQSTGVISCDFGNLGARDESDWWATLTTYSTNSERWAESPGGSFRVSVMGDSNDDSGNYFNPPSADNFQFTISPPPAPVPLPQLAIGTSGTNIDISFPTVAGFAYELQANTILNGGTWSPIYTASGNNATRSHSVPIGSFDSRFFRVRVYQIDP